MADITRLLRLVDGVSRNVDLATNTIVVSEVKVGGASGSILTKAILDKLILVQNQADADGSFDSQYSAIGHDHSGVYEPADSTILKEADVVDSLVSTSVVAPLSANQGKALKDLIDGITDNQTAAEVSFSNTASGLTATDVQAAIDEVEGRVDSAETAISNKINSSEKGAVNGVATLNASGKLTASQVPAIAVTDTFVVASQVAMLALSAAETGDVAVRTDINKSFILKGVDYSVIGDWQELLTPTDAVQSVNGQSGTVVLDSDDISEGASNKYYASSLFDADLATKDTGDLAEGSNLYFTDARAKSAAVANSISDSITDVAPSQNAVFDALAGKQAASANLDEADTFFGSTDLSAAEAEQLSDGSNADSLHKHSKLFQSFTNNTGASIAAGSVVCLNSVAGEVVKSDASAIATCDAIIGIAAEAIADGASGLVQIYGQAVVSKDVGETFTVGQRVFVSEVVGEATQTAPSTSLSIIFLLGYATGTNSVMLRMNFIAENE